MASLIITRYGKQGDNTFVYDVGLIKFYSYFLRHTNRFQCRYFKVCRLPSAGGRASLGDMVPKGLNLVIIYFIYLLLVLPRNSCHRPGPHCLGAVQIIWQHHFPGIQCASFDNILQQRSLCTGEPSYAQGCNLVPGVGLAAVAGQEWQMRANLDTQHGLAL